MIRFRIYLRSHAPGEEGRIDASSKTLTTNPELAVRAYRDLLARTDLVGQPVAAVLSRADAGTSGKAVYFSRFDRPVGCGRIAPDAALDPFASQGDGERLANKGAEPTPADHDWENDPRPFSEVLKDWERALGWRRRGEWKFAAQALGAEETTYDGWRNGRPCSQEKTFRKLMAALAASSGRTG